ncbi:MAG: hypothetical protein AAFV78_19960 [Bacteroidota bacterium]
MWGKGGSLWGGLVRRTVKALRSHQATQHPNLLVYLLTMPADPKSEPVSSSRDNHPAHKESPLQPQPSSKKV